MEDGVGEEKMGNGGESKMVEWKVGLDMRWVYQKEKWRKMGSS